LELAVSPKKDYTQGPTSEERAKKAMIQGAWLFGIGIVVTLASWFFCGLWYIMPVIIAIGAFRLLYGLVVWLTGWE
jgi:uncharacterized membrane protein